MVYPLSSLLPHSSGVYALLLPSCTHRLKHYSAAAWMAPQTLSRRHAMPWYQVLHDRSGGNPTSRQHGKGGPGALRRRCGPGEPLRSGGPVRVESKAFAVVGFSRARWEQGKDEDEG